MFVPSTSSFLGIVVGGAFFLAHVSTDSPAATPNALYAMGTQVDCHGRQRCASWLTRNFAGQKKFASRSKEQFTLKGLRAHGSTATSESGGGSGDTGPAASTMISDNNNGHGNDPGHVDESNPGNSSDNQPSLGNDSSNADAGYGQPHDDNGHGNDPGHNDSSNPGQGSGPNDGGNGSPNDNTNGNAAGNDNGSGSPNASPGNNGHGNDPGNVDGSNPGQGKGK